MHRGFLPLFFFVAVGAIFFTAPFKTEEVVHQDGDVTSLEP